MRNWLIVTTIAGTLTGCGDSASFNGRSGKKKPARMDAAALTTTCSEKSLLLDRTTLEKSGKKIRISGELCPSSSSDVHLQFVIDFSGSMGTNDPAIGGMGSATCGRYQAVKAIVDRINSMRDKEDKVTVSMISFGNNASTLLSEVDVGQFSPSAATICRQNGGGTNYRSAFEMSSASLAASPRKSKILYFISDGLPTLGGADNPFYNPVADTHAEAGRIAAENLRRTNPDVAFNALLLNPSNASMAYDPAQYLAQITGDAARVRIVNQATELADRAAELLSIAVNLETSKATARIAAEGGSSQNVPITNITQSPGSKDKWVFSTGDIDFSSLLASANGKPVTLAVDVPEAGSGRKQSTNINITVQGGLP